MKNLLIKIEVTDMDLNLIQNEILLNKKITQVSPSNLYEILYESKNWNKILSIVLNNIKTITGENLDVIVKNLWGYVQTNEEEENIKLDYKKIKDGLKIQPIWSFIFFVNSTHTKISIKNETGLVEEIKLNNSEILLFNTENFISENSEEKNRIALVGSLSNDLDFNKKRIFSLV